METAVKAADGRKPVIAGTGCASTKETIALTKEAEKLGIETCLIVCPFYNKPTQEGIYQHFKSIAENTTCNILQKLFPDWLKFLILWELKMKLELIQHR